MNTTIHNILFLCTGNSARSIIAEALVNHLPICRGKFQAYSAGSFPVGRVNPFAVELLQGMQIDTEGLRSKSWNEFSATGAPAMSFVFTVCDQAAGEQCPFWPGQPMTAHWGVPDPTASAGDEEHKLKAYKDTLLVLRRRIELFASLPLDKLDQLSVQKKIEEIGQQ